MAACPSTPDGRALEAAVGPLRGAPPVQALRQALAELGAAPAVGHTAAA